MSKIKKREVPSLLRTILDVDVYLSSAFVNAAEKLMPLRQLIIHYRALEISCHGIPWIVSLLASIWIANSTSLYQMQVNLLIGILIDLIIVALIKAIIRRRRPAKNGDPFAIGPDKYSFPSGHASRATLVVYFFLNLWPVPGICTLPLLAWATSVCLARILTKRHHILDVAAGIILGIFEGLLLSYIYLGKRASIDLVYWITDYKTGDTDDDV